MCSRSIIPRFDWLQGVSLLHYSAPFQFQGVRHLNGPPPLNVHLHSANCAPINGNFIHLDIHSANLVSITVNGH